MLIGLTLPKYVIVYVIIYRIFHCVFLSTPTVYIDASLCLWSRLGVHPIVPHTPLSAHVKFTPSTNCVCPVFGYVICKLLFKASVFVEIKRVGRVSYVGNC